jgi:hypothetical protein
VDRLALYGRVFSRNPGQIVSSLERSHWHLLVFYHIHFNANRTENGDGYALLSDRESQTIA